MTALQRRLIVFFLLSYVFTWWGFVLVRIDPTQTWARTNFALGPLIAAPIVIWFTEGRAGLVRWLARLVHFRAPVWVYAVSFFVPLGISALCTVFAIASGSPVASVPVNGFDTLLIFIVIVLLTGPFPEEVTFRGYGQNDLQEEISPFAASMWIGLGVVVWHLPLFLSGEDPWIIAVAIMAVSVVYAWLYVRGGSVWPLVIVHFVVNYFGSGFFQELLAPEGRYAYAVFLTVFYLAWAGLIVWQLGPSLGRKPRTA